MTTRQHYKRTKLRKMTATPKLNHARRMSNKRTKLTTKLNPTAGHQTKLRTKLSSRTDSTPKYYSPSL